MQNVCGIPLSASRNCSSARASLRPPPGPSSTSALSSQECSGPCAAPIRSSSSAVACLTVSSRTIGLTDQRRPDSLTSMSRTRRTDPVLSVDTKKKELVGAFRNGGRTWRPKGEPHRVNVHDFPSMAKGKAIPYGAYEIGEDRAVVNVGVTHDTAEFAVESIRRWWKLAGRKRKQAANRILICADGGGSNSSRSRAWKLHLQGLADELGIAVTVCHYPPGTSKWNKIEHRLFSFISLTWKGQPLINYETVVNLIGATKTKSGLRVKAILDTNEYETGVKVTKSQMDSLCIRRHRTHPTWNYTLKPRG